jgi:hypothetical protein
MYKKPLISAYLLFLSTPFAATDPEKIEVFRPSAESITELRTILVPKIFEHDQRLKAIIGLVNARARNVSGLVEEDHCCHIRWRTIKQLFLKGLDALVAQNSDLNSNFSEMYNTIVSAENRFRVDRIKLNNTIENIEKVYRFDSYTIYLILEWLQTNINDETSISEIQRHSEH